MTKSKSVLIVGGGVIGLCSAYYAMKKGHSVTVVERGGPGHDGCSFGNTGMIVPSHFIPLAAPGMVAFGLKMMLDSKSPFYIRPRLSWELLNWGMKFCRSATVGHVARSGPLLLNMHSVSRRCFEELSGELEGDFGLVKKGLLMLCKSPAAFHEETHVAEQARKLGLPAEVLSAAETAALEPNLSMDIAGAVYFRMDCHLQPGKLMAALTAALEKGGAKFVSPANVHGWRTDGKRVDAALTDRGDMSADEYVIAGGAWSPQLARGLKIPLPMQAGKGYSLTLASPRQLPSLCAILTEARVALTPMGGSLRFAGTMEITGLDESVSRRRVDGLIESIPRFLPAFKTEDFSGVPVWRGLRPCSPDGLPFVGRTKRYQNVAVATGHAMMGVSLAPITGKLIADVISDERTEIDMTLLSADRFE